MQITYDLYHYYANGQRPTVYGDPWKRVTIDTNCEIGLAVANHIKCNSGTKPGDVIPGGIKIIAINK